MGKAARSLDFHASLPIPSLIGHTLASVMVA
jgi:hypothetical protein